MLHYSQALVAFAVAAIIAIVLVLHACAHGRSQRYVMGALPTHPDIVRQHILDMDYPGAMDFADPDARGDFDQASDMMRARVTITNQPPERLRGFDHIDIGAEMADAIFDPVFMPDCGNNQRCGHCNKCRRDVIRREFALR